MAANPAIQEKAARIKEEMQTVLADFQFAGSESTPQGRVAASLVALAECVEELAGA